jgi:hypothetical protein
MASEEKGAGPVSAAIPPEEAASAMAAIDDRRAWLADRLIAPRWYHPAFGVLAGVLIAVAETRNWPLFYWAVAGYSAGCGALMWMNQRRVGVAVKYFRRRVSIVFAAQVLTLSALVAVACWLDLDRGRRGAFLVAGVLAVAITIVFGRWTDRALRADFQARR